MTQNNEKYTLGYAKVIIAKFMGYDSIQVGYADSEEETEWQRNNEEWMNKVGLTQVGRYFVNVNENKWHEWDDVKYDSGWDCLMPVVEKIEKYAHVRIQVGICAITHYYMALKRISSEQGIDMGDIMPIAEHNEYDFIGNVFHAVYDFIQWYNKNKPNGE